MDWIGLDWIGLDWIGLDWIGLDWIGLDWIGLDWVGFDWIGLDWIDQQREKERKENQTEGKELRMAPKKEERVKKTIGDVFLIVKEKVWKREFVLDGFGKEKVSKLIDKDGVVRSTVVDQRFPEALDDL